VSRSHTPLVTDPCPTLQSNGAPLLPPAVINIPAAMSSCPTWMEGHVYLDAAGLGLLTSRLCSRPCAATSVRFVWSSVAAIA
jgi:hypothetical protein